MTNAGPQAPQTNSTSNVDTPVTASVRAVRDVDGYLRTVLSERSLPNHLRDAATYSLLGPGKRLRPVLAVLSCHAVGGSTEQALPAAAAVEMIHAFSLVHDDLPAMDDDDLRRGRPTLHRHANEAMAILAGDLLNTLAFEVLATRVADATTSQQLVAELTVATNDMIAGQVYDTLPPWSSDAEAGDGAAIDPVELRRRLELIHRHKTGALIRAACRMGGLAGGGSMEQVDALGRFGAALGLKFQVVDDLLDVTSDAATMGKATGKDADAGKLTYPGVMGLDATRVEVDRLRRVAAEALSSLGEAARELRELADAMAQREH